MTEKATVNDAGCWLDSGRGVRIPMEIVQRAESWGYDPSPEYKQVAREAESDASILYNWEFIQEEADDAEEWMNEHVAPKGYYFGTHPYWGDWGLYSTLMGHDPRDLAGVGPVALEDLLDYVSEEDFSARVVYNRQTHLIQDIMQDEERKGLPDFVDIVHADRYVQGQEPGRYTVEVVRA